MSSLLAVPDRDIKFVAVKAGEVLKLGPITCRVLEDGSNTGNEQSSPRFKTIHSQTHPFNQTTASASPN
jgi:predicted nucleic acid binding AN1-type Zn finger protein